MTIYLEDGFDDGTFDAWDFTSNIQVTTTGIYVHSGTHGAIVNGGTSYVGTTVSETKPYIYCRFWFKIYHDTTSDTDYDRLAETYEDSASLFLLRLTIYKDGSDMKLRSQIRHQTGGAGGDVTVTIDTEVLNLNEWYCVEYLCFAGTGGTDKVWLDEREVTSVVCNYTGYTMENSFIFPAGYSYDDNLRAIDDCVYSNVYNGCDEPEPSPDPSKSPFMRTCSDIELNFERVLEWEESRLRRVKRKRVVGKCDPTVESEHFVTMPRKITITCRVNSAEKEDLWDAFRECCWMPLYDTGENFVDHVWLEEPSFRWDTSLGCDDEGRPFIATLGLICSNS